MPEKQPLLPTRPPSSSESQGHQRRSHARFGFLVAALSATAGLLLLATPLPATLTTIARRRSSHLPVSWVHHCEQQRPFPTEEETSLDRWLKVERQIAWDGVLANIGPACGAKPGLVIASPSRSSPNYYYTWTRDSALTFATIFSRFLPPPATDDEDAVVVDHSLEPLLREYVESQRNLQLIDNPSGGFTSGGLGEPKFHVNGSAFQGNWGRPQNDGPPLRALVLVRYAEFLLDRNHPEDERFVRSLLYDPKRLMAPSSVVKSDLEYAAHHWEENSFDLWEEISGAHFFTLLATHRALTLGSHFALRLSDPGASQFYLAEAARILDRLEDFWLPSESHIVASLPKTKFHRSGLDAAIFLGVLRAGGQGEETWGVAGGRTLATIVKYVDGFKELYGINAHPSEDWNGAVAVGRYTEDIYDGTGTSKANPWFICTFAVAETLYRAATYFESHRSIYVTETSLPFFQRLRPSATHRDIYTAAKPKEPLGAFEEVLEALVQWADGFLAVGKTFAGEKGMLSEQFDKHDGSSRGAKNLTWSFGALLDADNARIDYFETKNRHRRHNKLPASLPPDRQTPSKG